MKWNEHSLDAETHGILNELEKTIPDDIKQDDKLYNQVMNYMVRKAVRIRKGKLRPMCEKCREIKEVTTLELKNRLLIKDYTMKRVYIKGKLESIENKKSWTPVGWICPHCLTMITDKEAIEEKKKNEKIMKEEVDRVFTQMLEVMRGKRDSKNE